MADLKKLYQDYLDRINEVYLTADSLSVGIPDRYDPFRHVNDPFNPLQFIGGKAPLPAADLKAMRLPTSEGIFDIFKRIDASKAAKAKPPVSSKPLPPEAFSGSYRGPDIVKRIMENDLLPSARADFRRRQAQTFLYAFPDPESMWANLERWADIDQLYRHPKDLSEVAFNQAMGHLSSTPKRIWDKLRKLTPDF